MRGLQEAKGTRWGGFVVNNRDPRTTHTTAYQLCGLVQKLTFRGLCFLIYEPSVNVCEDYMKEFI